MEHPIRLVTIGFGVGTFGTLIGAGGGFILVPILLLLYPQTSPETITCISLAVVFFNALSGSWAYSRMKRIDVKSGLLFAAASVPGAILGALTTGYIPRTLFDVIFGILMILAGVYLFFSRSKEQTSVDKTDPSQFSRTLVEKNGAKHHFSYNLRLGMTLSLFVGYISSLLGIGGGIVHVPALVHFLNFPVHIATATSHFILAIMAFTGTIVHIVTGSFSHGGVRRTICLGIGVLLGAPFGAALSSRIHGIWIIKGLALALVFVGIRIFLMVFI